VTATPNAVANLVAPIVNDMGSDPTVSRVRLGTLAAQPGTTTAASIETIASGTSVLTDPFYIPTGFSLQMWIATVNLALDYTVLFEDILAQPSEQ
jgi:hypothetical protein